MITTTDRTLEALTLIQRTLDDVNHIATGAYLESGLDYLAAILAGHADGDPKKVVVDLARVALDITKVFDRIDHTSRWGLRQGGPTLVHPDDVDDTGPLSDVPGWEA